ncbi:hypothetical protein [uncultured Sphingomonas sp.]|uniref:hypothetical protein n=1 Tax=uncultured Sphingomonas sp. TaxID=158754 RepID=UPI0035C988D3
MNPADDLSGEWRGIFNYPAAQPPTEFTATLHDAGGTLSGHTVEPGLRGGTVTARIDGRRTGQAVTFNKLYDDERDGDYDTVAYRGAVDADGTEIAGRWTIPGAWSGTFIMVREHGIEAEIGLEATEEVR